MTCTRSGKPRCWPARATCSHGDSPSRSCVAVSSSRAPFAALTWEDRAPRPIPLARRLGRARVRLLLHCSPARLSAAPSSQLVYPLARGGAPVLVLLGALATGDRARTALAATAGRARGRGRRRARARGIARRRPGSGRAARARDRRPDRRATRSSTPRGSSTPAGPYLAARAASRPPSAPRSSSGRDERLRAELRPAHRPRRLRRLPRLRPRARCAAARSRRARGRRARDERPLRRGARCAAAGRARHGRRRLRGSRSLVVALALALGPHRPNGLLVATLLDTIFTCWTKWARGAHFC